MNKRSKKRKGKNLRCTRMATSKMMIDPPLKLGKIIVRGKDRLRQRVPKTGSGRKEAATVTTEPRIAQLHTIFVGS